MQGDGRKGTKRKQEKKRVLKVTGIYREVCVLLGCESTELDLGGRMKTERSQQRGKPLTCQLYGVTERIEAKRCSQSRDEDFPVSCSPLAVAKKETRKEATHLQTAGTRRWHQQMASASRRAVQQRNSGNRAQTGTRNYHGTPPLVTSVSGASKKRNKKKKEISVVLPQNGRGVPQR